MVQILNQLSEQVVFLEDVWLKSKLSAAVSASSGVGRAPGFHFPVYLLELCSHSFLDY